MCSSTALAATTAATSCSSKNTRPQHYQSDETMEISSLSSSSLPMVAVDFEDIQMTLDRMREKECASHYTRKEITNELTTLWRRMLVDWMYYVVDYCSLQRCSVAAAAFFLDIAMEKGLCQTRQDHQLAAATALQLALKTFDTTVIKLDKLVKLGRGQFTSDDVAAMEQKIIREMSWHLHPPSTYCFLRQYERLIPNGIGDSTREMMEDVTKLVAELTVSEAKYLRYPPSVLGYATILLGLETIPDEVIPIHLRQCFVVRMSAVANLDSSATIVLEAFDSLRVSLENSEKLEKVIDSIYSKTRKLYVEDALDGYSDSSSNHSSSSAKHGISDNFIGMHHSPRDVKVRIGRGGSFLSNSSISSLSPSSS
jgi:hypothetical protein